MISMNEQDLIFMNEALELAKIAKMQGEVPVGAVIVDNSGNIISKGYNLRENKQNATAHAELIAIEKACETLGSWRLSRCTLYVTLEPCPMCAGAIVNSRIERVVFGAFDMQAGCCGTLLNFNAYPFNHSFKIEGGVLEKECKEILVDFFKKKRKISLK